MRIAFVIYEGMTALDFLGVYDPVTRLKTMGVLNELDYEICAQTSQVRDNNGLIFHSTQSGEPLTGYDMVIIPGGFATRELVRDAAFLDWLKTAGPARWKVSFCTGSLLLGAAGLLEGKTATTHPQAFEDLQPFCNRVVIDQRVVEDGDVITARGVTSSIDLGLYLVEKLAGSSVRQQIQSQMDYYPEAGISPQGMETQLDHKPHSRTRSANINRQTRETQISLSLDVDGTGKHEIATGIGFLDHMLTHLAVHGLFDITLHAVGDLHVDVHHTVEDTAIALGQGFAQALGNRSGIIRTASAYTPMDEALAFVAVDFSGRPYTIVEVDWHSPSVGNIPTSLFPHFLESFATTARCNLHARVSTGRDDHHQAEALFKALARALDTATQIDPRRSGIVPSTKGSLTI